MSVHFLDPYDFQGDCQDCSLAVKVLLRCHLLIQYSTARFKGDLMKCAEYFLPVHPLHPALCPRGGS